MDSVKKAPVMETRSRDISSVVAEVVDPYLQLGSQGMESESGNASLWQQLAVQPLQITAYLTCLIGRLVSLDSGHCQKPLQEVLAELFTRDSARQDREDFIRWYSDWVKHAPVTPAALGQRSVALQHVLLNTLHFVATFYFIRCPKVPRPIYLRWEWARKQEQQQEAEQYVFKMISQDSHWTNKRSKDKPKFICSLVDHCRTGYARGSMTAYVSSSPPLTNHLKVMHSIHYAHLCQLLACGNDPSNTEEGASKRPTASAETAVRYVIELLRKLQISKSSKEEQLLPLLTMFCNLATMTPTLTSKELEDAYQAVQPFYLWPQPYCEVARDVLDFIYREQRCPGLHFRRILLTEHQIDVPHQDDITNINSEFVHIVVDKSAPRGEYFAAVFENQAMDAVVLKRKLLMHIFYSVFGYTSQKELTELEADLENCYDPDLSNLCYHGLTACEEAALVANQEQGRSKLTARLQHLKELLSQFRGRPRHTSLGSRASSELGVTVEEVYSFQAKPMLWLPAWRPHALHVFDGELSDASSAESVLQSILTEHQGQRRKDSLPTTSDIKHLRGLASRSQRLSSESSISPSSKQSRTGSKAASLPADSVMELGTQSPERSRPKSAQDDVSGSSSIGSGYSRSSRLSGADVIVELPASSPDSTPQATPKHLSATAQPSRDTPDEGSSSGGSSVLSEPEHLGDNSVSTSVPGSASTTLKPGSGSLGLTPEEEKSLDKEYGEFLVGSSGTSSNNSLLSPPSDGAPPPSQSAPPRQDSSLRPASISGSRSMDFSSAQTTGLASKFNFETDDLPKPAMHSSRSSASLDKAEAIPAAGLRKRSSYSQILKRRGSHKAVLSKKNPVIKLVFAGDDRTVRLITQGYVQLRRKFKFLFEGLDVKFYYIPLSSAGGGGGLVDTVPIQIGGTAQLPRRFHLYDGATTSSHRAAGNSDLMAALFDMDTSGSDELPYNGGDAWFGRFLSHLDGWYERNLMLSIHGSLRVLPQEALDSEAIINSLDDVTSESSGPTPRNVISDAVFNYCRSAEYEVKCRLYQIELTDTEGRTEAYVFLHRVEMIIPPKSKRGPELKLQIQKVGLDEVLQGITSLPVARYWGFRLSNIPHPSDVCPTNVESLGLEMTVMDSSANRVGSRTGSSVFRRSLRSGVPAESQTFHVAHVDGMATSPKDTFSVSIDSDVCCQNIVSFQVRPCTDSGKPSNHSHPRTMTMAGLGGRSTISSASVMSSPGSRRQSHGQSKSEDQADDIKLPIMIFWPPEL